MCAKKDEKEIEITPEMLAAALYVVLDRNDDSTVAGDPSCGYTTTIDGRWDLVQTFRHVLSLMRGDASVELDGGNLFLRTRKRIPS